MQRRTIHYLAPLTAVLLLVAMALGNLTRTSPQDAEPFHLRVRLAAQEVPRRIGAWESHDVEPPPSAVRLLKPNVLLSRVYQNTATGRDAQFLLVHCKTARDMAGHYPRNCYTSHGWTLDWDRPKDWLVGGLKIPGTEYCFSYHYPEGTISKIVANFMVMPDGQILRDIEGVRMAAADYTKHFFGAAQIQLVIGAEVPQEERDAIFHELIGANLPLIEVLRTGLTPPQD